MAVDCRPNYERAESDAAQGNTGMVQRVKAD